MGFNFDFSSLNLSNVALDAITDKKEREFVQNARIKHKPVMYRNALKAANQIDPNEDYFFLVSGSFVFGDFIEALCDVHKLKPKKILVSTLGMNQENVDSLVNLVDYLDVGEVQLIVSSYFYGVERRPGKLIGYMMHEFRGKPISVSICGSHTKLCLFEDSACGNIVMAGSANLSSSSNLEQFSFSHDNEVFKFCKKMFSGIAKDFIIFDGSTGKARFEQKGQRGHSLADKVEEYIREERGL